MIRGIYTAVSGLITQEAKQDVISSNLANANTVGYKKDSLISKSFKDVLVHNYDKEVNGKNVKNVIGNLTLGSKIDGTYTLFDQGVVQSTDKETDFAISGNGFFSLSTNDGNDKVYTRNGHFKVNYEGDLINESGYKVLGKNIQNGKIEPIHIGKGKIESDDSGILSIDDKPMYKLSIVDFNDHNSLKKQGDNYLDTGNGAKEVEAIVSQRALEKSNVNVMAEMSDMLMNMRTFESNQKVVQTLDETLDKTVNEIGRV